MAIHDRAVRFGDTVRDLLNDTDIARATVVDAARSFIDAQRRHVQREEERFSPWPSACCPPWTGPISRANWRAAAILLFGERVESRFQSLCERLLAWEAEDRAAEAAAGTLPSRP